LQGGVNGARNRPAPGLTGLPDFPSIEASKPVEEPMPKIRHLAIKTKNPARLAEFYAEVFDMKVINQEKSGAIYMSDGYLTLAILRNRGEATPSGINHFGFQVDDLADIEQRLSKFEEPMTARPSTRPYAEHRAMDPDGNLFDISVHGYDEIEYAGDRERKKEKV
jgi:catechol 2,3-dioxygenase-like lactoylglutathione lyase family enzyme